MTHHREELMQCLSYDHATGAFTWRIGRGNGVRAGMLAGALTRFGYVAIVLGRKRYYAHRLAWLFEHSEWPLGNIDHIDGRKSNNAIKNLRDVCHQMNMQNTHGVSVNNTSGYRGVSAKRNRWRASISVDGKQVSLGSFDTPEEAHAAYLHAKKTNHEGFVA